MVSDEEIFQSYHDLFMQIRDVVIKHKKAAGFHGSARILESLNKQADLSQRQLADEASIKPGSLTVAIEKIGAPGFWSPESVIPTTSGLSGWRLRKRGESNGLRFRRTGSGWSTVTKSAYAIGT